MRDVEAEIMGLSDGQASALGFVLSLALFASVHGLAVGAISGAVGAGASMGGSEWLADNGRGVRSAVVMGVATFVGCLLPAVPLFVSTSWPGFVGTATVAIGLGVLISRLRRAPQPRSYFETFGVLVGASALALVAGALVPGGGGA